ncbi:MAG TPA: glycosyltransferase family 4 protein [Nitrososphaerales archaeon]|nr:glycosyltransferase family 4 protein [Nitrososphaerales archaeon]
MSTVVSPVIVEDRPAPPRQARHLKICINTQTPLVQFTERVPRNNGQEDGVSVTDLATLTEGVDYQWSVGGLTRMVFPLVNRMLKDGTLEDAHWISLNPNAPATVKIGGITLHHVALEKDRLAGYGNTKEAIWGAVHGTTANDRDTRDVFWSDDFSEFEYYNRVSAELITKLDEQIDFDLFYIHDFQQLPVGRLLNTLKPKIFRWHIPFDQSMIPSQWRELLASYFNSYDMVIVSSTKYLNSLKSFGYEGRVRKIYPFIDPADYSQPFASEVAAACSKLGISDEDIVILSVGRMDPMKGQDRAIRAASVLVKDYPNLKIVFVGNGSFSGSGRGLGLSKSAVWREKLEILAKELGVEKNVVFAGHLSQKELDAMYERCSFTVLPSVKEGFGLVVVESWLHSRASIVTNEAGVAELVQDGKNGMLVDPNNTEELASKMAMLLGNPELTKAMGEAGLITSKLCSMEEGLKAETRAIDELLV